MTFNDKVDAFMKSNNIGNIKQLAILSDIPYTTLKDFYDKKSVDNSRLSTVRKLARFMGCTMDYLAFDNIIDFNGNSKSKSNKAFDELEVLFKKHRDILTKDDEETMRFLIEKRIREIDKQNNDQ